MPEQRKVVELIRRLCQQDVAVVSVSHSLVDIFAVATRHEKTARSFVGVLHPAAAPDWLRR